MKLLKIAPFIWFLALLLLAGCDPGYLLYVHNRSAKTKRIEVTYASDSARQTSHRHTYPLVRFYPALVAAGKVAKRPPLQIVRKDSISADWQKSYTFLLPPGQTAEIDRGIGGPHSQLVIVDGFDSVRTNVRSPRMRSRRYYFAIYSVHSIDVMR